MPEIFTMIIKAFRNKCNIICLCLKTSTETDYYKFHVSKLCTLIDKGSFPFKNYTKSMGKDCVLLKFFQPDHAEWVYNMNKWTGKNFQAKFKHDDDRYVPLPIGGKPRELIEHIVKD